MKKFVQNSVWHRFALWSIILNLVNHNQCNEPFAVSLYQLCVLILAWLRQTYNQPALMYVAIQAVLALYASDCGATSLFWQLLWPLSSPINAPLIQHSVIPTTQNPPLWRPIGSTIHSTVLAPFWIRAALGYCCPSSGLRVVLHALCLVCNSFSN